MVDQHELQGINRARWWIGKITEERKQERKAKLTPIVKRAKLKEVLPPLLERTSSEHHKTVLELEAAVTHVRRLQNYVENFRQLYNKVAANLDKCPIEVQEAYQKCGRLLDSTFAEGKWSKRKWTGAFKAYCVEVTLYYTIKYKIPMARMARFLGLPQNTLGQWAELWKQGKSLDARDNDGPPTNPKFATVPPKARAELHALLEKAEEAARENRPPVFHPPEDRPATTQRLSSGAVAISVDDIFAPAVVVPEDLL
jgi:hypothetical protein